MAEQYKIYLDMDGVITDWNKQFESISGGVSSEEFDKEHGEGTSLQLSQNASPEFYANMEWTPDGKMLYNFLKYFDCEILSHANRMNSEDNRVLDGKNTWLKNNNISIPQNLVPNREDKQKFSNATSILIDDRSDNIQEFISAGGIGILHTDSETTMNKLNELINGSNSNNNTQRIYNSILNPDLWDSDGEVSIKPEVLEKLKNVAKRFYDEVDFTVPIHDIIMLGSSTGYNWTPDSDIDLHIVIDFKDVDDDEMLVKQLADIYKNDWNNKHDVKIKNHEVEVYIQDVNEKNNSESSFSILKNQWLKKPVYKEPTIDKDEIKRKYKRLKNTIDTIISDPTEDRLLKLLKHLYKMRQAGLDLSGEYSTENIVFKILRKNGYMDKIRDCIYNISDEDMSLK